MLRQAHRNVYVSGKYLYAGTEILRRVVSSFLHTIMSRACRKSLNQEPSMAEGHLGVKLTHNCNEHVKEHDGNKNLHQIYQQFS